MPRRLSRYLPSPAMVVALVALFVATSGSAYALVITGKSIRNNTVTGADIRNGSLKSRDHARASLGGRAIKESSLGIVPRAFSAALADGVTHHAVVTAAGVSARVRGVASVARTGEGRYQVILDRDVRGCVYVASVGDAGAAVPPTGEASVSALATNVNGVAVRTRAGVDARDRKATTVAADRPFHLIVAC
jgi:hypothetical protein